MMYHCLYWFIPQEEQRRLQLAKTANTIKNSAFRKILIVSGRHMPDSQTAFSRLQTLEVSFTFYHTRELILLEKNTFTVMTLLELCNLRKIYYHADWRIPHTLKVHFKGKLTFSLWLDSCRKDFAAGHLCRVIFRFFLNGLFYYVSSVKVSARLDEQNVQIYGRFRERQRSSEWDWTTSSFL